MMTLRHPSFHDLETFADGPDPARSRPALAAHLASCARCRRVLIDLRALSSAASALPTPARRDPGFEGIRRRIRSGERLWLPRAARPSRPPRRTRPMTAAAAALAVLAAAAHLWSPADELVAADSILELRPARPRPGDAIDVRYHPGVTLANEERLVLRARLRQAGAAQSGAGSSVVVLDTLHRRRGGTFEGRIRLSTEVAYAAFAVEDVSGERVDDNQGRPWEVWVHGPSGRPTHPALVERAADLRERNWEMSLSVAREAVATEPDSVYAWLVVSSMERELLRGGAAVEARNALRQEVDRLHRHYSRRADVAPETAANLWMLAWRSSGGVLASGAGSQNPDSAGSVMAYWKDRVLAQGSVQHRALIAHALYAVTDHFDEPREGLSRLDALWSRLERPTTVVLDEAALLARRTGDTAEVRRWLLRGVAADSARAVAAGRRLVAIGHATEGVALLENGVRALERIDDPQRPLGMTRARHATLRRMARARALAELGWAYAAVGETARARRTLAEAAGGPWENRALTRAADGLLSLGDRRGAEAAFARLSADPLRTRAWADSVRALVGAADDERWNAARAAARRDMIRDVLDGSAPRPIQARALRLEGLDGRSWDLAHEARGRFAVVSFWSRLCGYSLGELRELHALQQRLDERGTLHVAVHDPVDRERLAGDLAEWGGTGLRVDFDIEGDLVTGFRAWGTPDHYVVDEAGLIRYRARGSGRLDDVVRALLLLEGETRPPPGR